MIRNVFERYEKKYLLTGAQYSAVKQAVEGIMVPDEYGSYAISNIYYDTPDYRLIRESIAKPPYKEKLRLRGYGTPIDESRVFVELKKKAHGIVYKRRVEMMLEEAQRYLSARLRPGRESQILREIDWFTNTYPVVPAAYITYDREAFCWPGEDFRLTFDQNIRGRHGALRFAYGRFGVQLLPPDTWLMELKAPGVIPLWFCRILSENDIFPTSFSKYGTYYQQHILAESPYAMKKGEKHLA